jgi:hypothetical protein
MGELCGIRHILALWSLFGLDQVLYTHINCIYLDICHDTKSISLSAGTGLVTRPCLFGLRLYSYTYLPINPSTQCDEALVKRHFGKGRQNQTKTHKSFCTDQEFHVQFAIYITYSL